jgi:hypothetical protein
MQDNDNIYVVKALGMIYLHYTIKASSTTNLMYDRSWIISHLGWNHNNEMRHSIDCF